MTKGCLVVHGLTGTPATVTILQERLIAQGFRVIAPCLAGHGGSASDLAHSTWHDWYDTVRIAFGNLRLDVDKVYYAGISLGALLGLKLALDEGWGVRALALLSTPLKFSWVKWLAIPAVRYSPLRWVIKEVPKDFKKSVADEEGRIRYEEYSLPTIPTPAVYELMELQQIVKEKIGQISNPILMLHGKNDSIAPLSNVEFVQRSAASDIVETAIFPRSRHLLTLDIEKEAVASTVVDFFKRFA